MNGRIGKYEIIQEIGRGGMGIVYKALNPDTQAQVAIKTLLPQYSADPNVISRFKSEGMAAGRLQHPNIVRIYDVDQFDGLLCIVMEFLDGSGLDKIIPDGGVRNWDWVREVSVQIGRALRHAHQHDVVHRDVKPSNVIIGQEQRAVLTDFGIAKVRNLALTTDGTSLGTPEYMSPEQVRGETLDARSDLYSLGIVMFDMIVGRPPFGGDTPLAVMYQHVEKPTPLISSSHPDIPIPADLNTIIYRLMAKDLKQRFQSADEFLEAMGKMQVQPVLVPPPIPAPPVPPIPEGPFETIYCNFCGTQLEVAPDDKFCIWCGKPLPERLPQADSATPRDSETRIIEQGRDQETVIVRRNE
jgi:serine/threonine-protein kinase